MPARSIRALIAAAPWHLFPREVCRGALEALDARLDPREACRVHVWLLHPAAMNGCEERLARHLDGVLYKGRPPDPEIARAAVAPAPTASRSVGIPAPSPAAHDGLLADPIIEGTRS